MRYLFIPFHYPKPTYRQDLLKWIGRVGAALRAQPGLLQLGDFEDAANGRRAEGELLCDLPYVNLCCPLTEYLRQFHMFIPRG